MVDDCEVFTRDFFLFVMEGGPRRWQRCRHTFVKGGHGRLFHLVAQRRGSDRGLFDDAQVDLAGGFVHLNRRQEANDSDQL